MIKATFENSKSKLWASPFPINALVTMIDKTGKRYDNMQQKYSNTTQLIINPNDIPITLLPITL